MERWTLPLGMSLIVTLSIGLNPLGAQFPPTPLPVPSQPLPVPMPVPQPQPQLQPRPQPQAPLYFPNNNEQTEELLRQLREWEARQLFSAYSHYAQAVVPPYVLLVPVVPYEPALHPPYPMPFYPPPPPPPAAHPHRRLLNNHNIGCQANSDGACGSFHSEMRFIFGSCRSFFLEPCVPNQPSSPHR